MSKASVKISYDRRFAGYSYDLLARMVFSPVGGIRKLREGALAAMDLAPGMRVLELGCGTGGFTRLLVERGAIVTAVDQSEPMLSRARRRAPSADFECAEITAYVPRAHFDRVLFSFVLHELNRDARQQALLLARRTLTPGGAVVVVDHAIPDSGRVPRAVSALVHGFEPASLVAWVRGGFDGEIRSAGLVPLTRRPLARGTAIVITAGSASSEPG